MENKLSYHLKEAEKELKQNNFEVEKGRVHEPFHDLLESKECLIQSYENTVKELKERDTMLVKKQKTLEFKIEQLKLELTRKCMEADELMDLQNKLLQINQSKVSSTVQKEMQLKECEEKSNRLSIKLEDMEKKVNDLLLTVKEKTEEVDKGKQLQENLLKQLEFQALEIMKNEQLLRNYQKDNGLLAAKVQSLSTHGDEIQKELQNKISELEEGTKVQNRLLQEREALDLERIKRGRELEESEKERRKVLDRNKDLEEKVDKLRECLYATTKESSEGMELHGKLLQKIEAKNSELLSEKRRRIDAITAYKRLKSEFNFLRKKYHPTPENMLPCDKEKDESEVVRQDQIPSATCDQEGGKDILEDNKGVVILKKSRPVSPSTSSILIAAKFPTCVKSCPPIVANRVVSRWRDTRSHQSSLGPDPHDDFLNTPMEKLLENLGKVPNVDNHKLTNSCSTNTNFVNSDDETQDMNIGSGSRKQEVPPPNAVTSGFKYVKPVRRKSERESLKGVECRQCKKFYDAVRPEASENPNSNKQRIRCEHHEGVSRHRYLYGPPSTPDGFWDIGFESET
ncbi:protein gamma response 1 [Dorcoceras hygrometricum]|uniref:Protein gamma response 1 n=1 Tax=Dorcoceras hygrometricum TaxID=472368 RepID=A0A2Z7CNR6_9LAMI|nr:protein gamma response 1 [Dorcoceras hygrometricum]